MEFICNKCGKKFDKYDELENYSYKRKMGYGTIYDGMMLDLHICCDCMEEFISSCKVVPVQEDVKANVEGG